RVDVRADLPAHRGQHRPLHRHRREPEDVRGAPAVGLLHAARLVGEGFAADLRAATWWESSCLPWGNASRLNARIAIFPRSGGVRRTLPARAGGHVGLSGLELRPRASGAAWAPMVLPEPIAPS